MFCHFLVKSLINLIIQEHDCSLHCRTLKLFLNLVLTLMLPCNYMRNHYRRHYIALPFVNHSWYIDFNACRYITPIINTNKQTNKQISKQAIGLKPETSWSLVEYFTTAAMGKEGVIDELSSFYKDN